MGANIELLREVHRGAACRDEPDVFLTKDREPGFAQKFKAAKEMCDECNVKAKCLEWAMLNDEPYGIWGGLSPRQRRAKKRRERNE